jgi:hypothetical protein
LPVAAESELDGISGAQIAYRHREVHLVSAEKEGVERVDEDEAIFFAYALHKPMKPAAVVRRACRRFGVPWR